MTPTRWPLAAAALAPLAAMGALVGFLLLLQPPPAPACAGGEATGEPVGPPEGNLGGVAGTGLTQAEVDTVRGHPAAGTAFTEGSYLATAYGPPWGGLQGPGEATAGGVRLNGGAPRLYLVAVDPSIISLGKWVYVWPNPFGWRGPFLAADTGNWVTGRHLDFYDWRGREQQLRWHTQVEVAAQPILGGVDDPLGTLTTPVAPGELPAPDPVDSCSGDISGVGPIDFGQAKRIDTPGRMVDLPAWATARGYTSAAVVNGHARADSRIVSNLLSILQKYDLRVHDCLASGHNTHGNGDSCDIVPADDPLPRPGRMTPGWSNVTRLAQDLGWQRPGPGYPGGYACNSGAPYKPAISIVCFDGDVNHGDPDHITGRCACPHLHLSWKSAILGAPTALSAPPAWVYVFTGSDAEAPDGGSR